MISVIFTCKGRPALTELCLRRLVELMPQPYELLICYDKKTHEDIEMLATVAPKAILIQNLVGGNRWDLINEALREVTGNLFMHVENDFYWVDPMCLDSALSAFYFSKEPLDYIRFEHLPFTYRDFYHYENYDGKDICWMRDEAPYRFTFNPHIRKFKYPTDEPFKTEGFTKQPEQHHNDGYKYQSACMTGDNWRHLGIYDEGGHYKEYYADRFTGRRNTKNFDPWTEFVKITDNPHYLDLFMRYLNDNRDKRSKKLH